MVKKISEQHANIDFDDGLGNSFWDATANNKNKLYIDNIKMVFQRK